jgi:hypothetical protein
VIQWLGLIEKPVWYYIIIWEWNASLGQWLVFLAHMLQLPEDVEEPTGNWCAVKPQSIDPKFYQTPPYKVWQMWRYTGAMWQDCDAEVRNWK